MCINVHSWFSSAARSTVKEIEAVIPKLSRAETEEIRNWIDDYLEDPLELTHDVKGKLDQRTGGLVPER